MTPPAKPDLNNNYTQLEYNYEYPPIGYANILIIGCGGAGNNTIDRLMKMGIMGARCIAINTDLQHLNSIEAHQKLLIGKNLTRGLGAGGEPEIGKAAAQESSEEIAQLVKNSDLIFITCGMGGGTGTGSAPIIAEIARKTEAIVVAVVTMPFEAERGRMKLAKEGLRKLRLFVDTLVVIDNNRLLKIAADLPISEAFGLADEVLATMVKGITETISMPSLINLDYADIRTILKSGGVAIVGIGESINPENRVEEAIEDALNSPLLDFDITGAKGALIHVTGGLDLKLNETTKVAEIVAERMDPGAKIIWGARIDEKFNGILRVMLLITGIKSPQIMGNKNSGLLDPLYASSELTGIPKLSNEFFNIKQIPTINEKFPNFSN